MHSHAPFAHKLTSKDLMSCKLRCVACVSLFDEINWILAAVLMFAILCVLDKDQQC